MELEIKHSIKSVQEWAAKVRVCNSIKFETSPNLPPVLKIVSWSEVAREVVLYQGPAKCSFT